MQIALLLGVLEYAPMKCLKFRDTEVASEIQRGWIHVVCTTCIIIKFTYYHGTNLVYFAREVYCTSNVLHRITPYSTVHVLRYHIHDKCTWNSHITVQ